MRDLWPHGFVAAGSPVLKHLRRQLYDASEFYRFWPGDLPIHPARAHIDEGHSSADDQSAWAALLAVRERPTDAVSTWAIGRLVDTLIGVPRGWPPPWCCCPVPARIDATTGTAS